MATNDTEAMETLHMTCKASGEAKQKRKASCTDKDPQDEHEAEKNPGNQPRRPKRKCTATSKAAASTATGSETSKAPRITKAMILQGKLDFSEKNLVTTRASLRELQRMHSAILDRDNQSVIDDAKLRAKFNALFARCHDYAMEMTDNRPLNQIFKSDALNTVLQMTYGSDSTALKYFADPDCSKILSTIQGGARLLMEAMLCHRITRDILKCPLLSLKLPDNVEAKSDADKMFSRVLEAIEPHSADASRLLHAHFVRAYYAKNPVGRAIGALRFSEADSKEYDSNEIRNVKEAFEVLFYDMFDPIHKEFFEPRALEHTREIEEGFFDICFAAAQLSGIMWAQNVRVEVWGDQAKDLLSSRNVIRSRYVEAHCSMKLRPDNHSLDHTRCDFLVRPAIIAKPIGEEYEKVWCKASGRIFSREKAAEAKSKAAQQSPKPHSLPEEQRPNREEPPKSSLENKIQLFEKHRQDGETASNSSPDVSNVSPTNIALEHDNDILRPCSNQELVKTLISVDIKTALPVSNSATSSPRKQQSPRQVKPNNFQKNTAASRKVAGDQADPVDLTSDGVAASTRKCESSKTAPKESEPPSRDGRKSPKPKAPKIGSDRASKPDDQISKCVISLVDADTSSEKVGPAEAVCAEIDPLIQRIDHQAVESECRPKEQGIQIETPVEAAAETGAKTRTETRTETRTRTRTETRASQIKPRYYHEQHRNPIQSLTRTPVQDPDRFTWGYEHTQAIPKFTRKAILLENDRQ